MKVLEAYQIPIISLEDKLYQYTFEGQNDFFAAFEQDWLRKGQFVAVVDLNKTATMLQVELKINGAICLVCDRSLEEFDYSFEVNEKLNYKYADHSEDMGNNLFLLDRKESRLNLSQDLFDFIALKVPMKKLHPRFVAETELADGNIFLYTTVRETSDNQRNEKEIDPRWEILKKLKDNN